MNEGGGVTGDKAAKLVNAAQVSVSAYVSVTSLNDFEETSGQFPAMCAPTKPGYY